MALRPESCAQRQEPSAVASQVLWVNQSLHGSPPRVLCTTPSTFGSGLTSTLGQSELHGSPPRVLCKTPSTFGTGLTGTLGQSELHGSPSRVLCTTPSTFGTGLTSTLGQSEPPWLSAQSFVHNAKHLRHWPHKYSGSIRASMALRPEFCAQRQV